MSGKGAKISTAYVPAGEDRFRRNHEIQYTRTMIDIKVSTFDTDGGLSVAEITSSHKGGPARHLHHEQDEWFYIVEGEYVIEVGEERTCGPMSGRGLEDCSLPSARGRDRGIFR
jgi:mannose-6-phosphate isomerase-like protein (cupin superfamily)